MKVSNEDVNPIRRYLAIDDMLNSKEHEVQVLGMIELWPLSDIPKLIDDREKSITHAHNMVSAGISLEVDKVVQRCEGITKELLEILDKL